MPSRWRRWRDGIVVLPRSPLEVQAPFSCAEAETSWSPRIPFSLSCGDGETTSSPGAKHAWLMRHAHTTASQRLRHSQERKSGSCVVSMCVAGAHGFTATVQSSVCTSPRSSVYFFVIYRYQQYTKTFVSKTDALDGIDKPLL